MGRKSAAESDMDSWRKIHHWMDDFTPRRLGGHRRGGRAGGGRRGHLHHKTGPGDYGGQFGNTFSATTLGNWKVEELAPSEPLGWLGPRLQYERSIMATKRRYLAVLSGLFLIRLLPAWHRNPTLRLAKAPKVMLVDTGLACHLADFDHARLQSNLTVAGHLAENRVAMEIAKQAGWARTSVELFHFRTLAGAEVDLVLEDRRGRVVGIEVKLSESLSAADLRPMESLRQAAGDKFVRGIIFYGGTQSLPFGPNCWAFPIDALWSRFAPRA